MHSTLNVTPEGSLNNIPAATGGNANLKKEQQAIEAPEIEIRGTQPSATMRTKQRKLPVPL